MSKLEALTIHTAHNTLKQSSEMLLYDTFKLYFDIDLENDIQHINESKEALDTFLKDCKNDYIQILQNDITFFATILICLPLPLSLVLFTAVLFCLFAIFINTFLTHSSPPHL